jgi:hypothetical protein
MTNKQVFMESKNKVDFLACVLPKGKTKNMSDTEFMETAQQLGTAFTIGHSLVDFIYNLGEKKEKYEIKFFATSKGNTQEFIELHAVAL